MTFDQSQKNRLQHVLSVSSTAGYAVCRAKDACMVGSKELLELTGGLFCH
jgi:hypothetical protein